jgi:cytochrome c556
VTAKTRAKPEVWKEHDKFVAADKQVAAQIVTLDEAVKSGDKGRIETVFNEIKFCDACHATFRAPAQ